MTILILHEGRAWACGSTPAEVGKDCGKILPSSPMEFVGDAGRRVLLLARAMEVLEGSEAVADKKKGR